MMKMKKNMRMQEMINNVNDEIGEHCETNDEVEIMLMMQMLN